MKLNVGVCVICCLAAFARGQIPFMNPKDLVIDDELIPTGELIPANSQ